MTLASEAASVKRDTIRYEAPERQLPDGITVTSLPDNEPEDDSGLTVNDDGSITVNDVPKKKSKNRKNFNANLAEEMDPGELSSIASELLQAIEEDKRSRKDWEETVARGIDLLGFKIESSSSEVSGGGAIAKAKSTLLAEAVLRYQSNFNAEMLPADGPVKVRDDTVQAPAQPTPPDPRMGHNGGPPLEEPQGFATGGVPGQPQAPMGGTAPPPAPPQAPPQAPPGGLGAALLAPTTPDPSESDLAQAFEKDFNYFLTVGDPVYYPDTDRMSFSQALAGCAFKKVYKDPIEKVPRSRFAMAQHVIVNNGASSLHDAKRITHEIPNMSPREMKQMMLAGAYLEVDLSTPNPSQDGPVDSKIAELEGRQPHMERQEDLDHTVMECYCYRNLQGFEEKGDLPVPYRITIEKDSQQVLEIRRDWKEGDKTFKRRRHFVKYALFPGLGFYDYGYVHLLGNTTRILSAIESLMVDQGMFANFPGGMIDKMAAKQETNQIRPGPGGFKPIDTGGRPINQVVMPMPYKDVSANLMALAKSIDDDARKLGSIAELPLGEGRADVPVGTVLALLENSKVLISAVHRRNFASQHEEFELLKELFAEDPAALAKVARKNSRAWETAEEFQDVNLIPMADPNTSSNVERIGRATALVQIAQQTPPGILNVKEILRRTFKVMSLEDIDALFLPPPDPSTQPPPPHVADAQAKQAQLAQKSQSDLTDAKVKLQIAAMESQSMQQSNATQMQISQDKLKVQAMKDAQEFQAGITPPASMAPSTPSPGGMGGRPVGP